MIRVLSLVSLLVVEFGLLTDLGSGSCGHQPPVTAVLLDSSHALGTDLSDLDPQSDHPLALTDISLLPVKSKVIEIDSRVELQSNLLLKWSLGIRAPPQAYS